MSHVPSTEKGSIIFASNAVTIAVDADLRGSISVPGKPTSATVILSTFDKTIKLYILLNEKLSPPVAVFDISRGFKGDLFPAQKSWVMKGNPYIQSQEFDKSQTTNDMNDYIDIGANVRLTFKSEASFWAFAYYVSGINGPLPRGSETSDTYGLTFGGDLYQSLVSSQAVFEFPAST